MRNENGVRGSNRTILVLKSKLLAPEIPDNRSSNRTILVLKCCRQAVDNANVAAVLIALY